MTNFNHTAFAQHAWRIGEARVDRLFDDELWLNSNRRVETVLRYRRMNNRRFALAFWLDTRHINSRDTVLRVPDPYWYLSLLPGNHEPITLANLLSHEGR